MGDIYVSPPVPESRLDITDVKRLANYELYAAAGLSFINPNPILYENSGLRSANIDNIGKIENVVTLRFTGSLTDGALTIRVNNNSTSSEKIQDSNGIDYLEVNGGNPYYTISYTVDLSAPAAFTVGSVTPKGGTEVAGYWNSTNTSVDIVVPIDNDSTLTGGSVQIQAKVGTNAYANTGTAAALASGDLNGNKTISLSAATFEGLTGFTDDAVVSVRAVITDIAGKSTTGTASAATITVDRHCPRRLHRGIGDTEGGHRGCGLLEQHQYQH